MQSLTFGGANTTRVTMPNTVFNQLNENSVFTWLEVFRLSTFTGGRMLASKNGQDGNGGPIWRLNGTTEMDCLFARSSVNDQSGASTSANLQTGVWYIAGATRDPNASQIMRIYLGTLTTPIVELDTGGTFVNGSGISAGTKELMIANQPKASPNLSLQGDISVFSAFNRILTLDEMNSWARNPRLMLGCYVHMPLGVTGNGTQLDLSPYRNHGTVTGAGVGPVAPIAPYLAGRNKVLGRVRGAVNGGFCSRYYYERMVA
jgi:hypothetical protein